MIPQNPKPTPGHINCHRCHAEDTSGCLACGYCISCGCRCLECGRCERNLGPVTHPPRYFCKVCRFCKKSCTCRNAPQSLNLRKPLHNQTQNNLNRWLGLEIELVPVGDLKIQRLAPWVRYNLVRDGSLTEGGQEMVVNPLIGDQFQSGVASIAKALRVAGSGVDASCGFHVHVGAKDFGPFELRRLINLYSQLESNIFETFCTPDRILSRFCQPYRMEPKFYKDLNSLKSPGELKDFLIRWLYSETIEPRTGEDGEGNYTQLPGFRNLDTIRRHKYEPCRYHGLNLHSWFQRQTIEFRHHQGTIDGTRLLYWPLFCGWLVEVASSLKDSEVFEISRLADLLGTCWKRPFKYISIPKDIKDWVQTL